MRPKTAFLMSAPALLLLALFGASSSASADSDNNASTATPITDGVFGPYDIESGGDRDWFVFTLNNTSVVRIELRGPGGEDSALYLYTANGSYLAFDDDGGVGAWSLITIILQPGTYYPVVQNLYLYGTIAEYNITLTTGPAAALPEGSSGPFDLAGPAETDWYIFTLGETSRVRIETNGTDGDTALVLYSSSMYQVAFDHGSASPYDRILALLDPGTYFLEVYNYSGSGPSFGYTLLFETAPPLPLSEGPNGPFAWSQAALQQWFVLNFTGATNQTSIRLTLNASAGYAGLTLYDSNRYYIDGSSTSNSTAPVVFYATLYYSTYYVQVGSSYAYTPFTFTLDLATAGPDGFDGNGQMSSATPIPTGLNGPFDLVPVGDNDWYSFSVPAEGIVEVQLTNGGWNTYITLYDANGSYIVGSSGYSGSGYITSTVSGGFYYILIYDYAAGYDIIGYTLDLRYAEAPPPDNNDDRASATPIVAGESGPFILFGSDVDWYLFVASETGTLSVETSGPSGGALVSLYDENNNWLADGSGGNYSGSFQMLTKRVDAGTYYLRVGLPYNTQVVPEYNITIAFAPYTSPDGNDFKSQAGPIRQGLNGPFDLHDPEDVDWYYFDVTDVGLGTIETVFVTGWARLVLYDNTGAYLSEAYYYNTVVSEYFEPGRYFVKAYYYYGGAGAYSINLTLPDLTPPPLEILSPANGSTVAALTVAITGTTEPGALVLANGQLVYVEPNGRFTATVLVPVGPINISIAAFDYKLNSRSVVWMLIGEDPNAATNAKLEELTQHLEALQEQLSHLNVTNNQTVSENGELEAKLDAQNETLAAAQREASAQRGLAFGAMALSGLAAAAAIAGAVLMVRKRPPTASTAAPPPASYFGPPPSPPSPPAAKLAPPAPPPQDWLPDGPPQQGGWPPQPPR